MPKHIVIFSHGFGVRRDSRGMFTDLVAALPKGTKPILFDYNRFNTQSNRLTVAPLSKQARKLAQVIARVRRQNPDAVIDLICHSQGCIVAGLLKPKGLRKILLLAPPSLLDAERMANIFAYREGAHFDVHGTSTFPRRDGTTTIVPKAFWPDLAGLNPVALYNELGKTDEVIVVNAHQDEILGQVDFAGLSPQIKVIGIEAGHDFTAQARHELLQAVTAELT